MTYISSFILLISLCFCNNSEKKVDYTATLTSDKDSIVSKFGSGFYLAFNDTSNKQGLKMKNSNQYYLLNSDPLLTFDQIDNITKEYSEPIKCFLINIKFNSSGTKAWLDFTTTYQGLKVAIVSNSEIIYVATIHEPIHSGVCSIMAQTEVEADNYKLQLEKELTIVKK